MSAESRDNITDEEFIRLCEACVDVGAMLEYFQFIQAAGLGYNNYYNNVYMWAMWNGENYVYYLSPWDMDQAFEQMLGNNGQDSINLCYALCWRMLNLDVKNARQLFWESWNEKRNGMISDDAMYNRIQGFEDMINRSGAYLRETEKWAGEARTLDLRSVKSYAVDHLHVADFMFIELWPSDNAARVQ